MKAKLYIVATPIGNLGDITFRAIETLKEVDFVLCEDTRVTKKLLRHYDIDVKTISYHQHSSEKKIREIIDLLCGGKNLALVTDAGTPGISDPGNKLTEILVKNNIEIIPTPGVSAVTTILSISGFPTDKFVFLGFPPHKKRRSQFFQEVAESKYTAVFYESSHRIKKMIDNLADILDKNREVVIGRELTKKFESVYRGTIDEIKDIDIPEKGEFAVVVRGKR